MKFNNTDLKKDLVKKYLGKYINIPDRTQKRCFIGYNYDKDIVVVETPGGNHFVEELAELSYTLTVRVKDIISAKKAIKKATK